VRLSIKWKTHPNVPDSSFQPYLLILANAALAAVKSPEDSERICEDAYQRVTGHLPKRPKEEIDLSRGKKTHDYTRLRFKFARMNLKLLRRELWSFSGGAPPLGPALMMIVRTIDLVLQELSEAYAAAPPLDDEKASEARALPEIDVDVPDAANADDDELPRKVDYTELIG
jgi:hypothetical protein